MPTSALTEIITSMGMISARFRQYTKNPSIEAGFSEGPM
jgi:hypothetical protein